MIKDAIVNKILGLRDKYKLIRSPKNVQHFNDICDKVQEELDEFKREFNVEINIRLIAAADDDFEIYQNTGAIKEFIVRGDGVL